MHTGGHLSKEFFELVKAIGESRSKQEEDKIILNEVAALKATINLPGVSLKAMKEYMVRAVYVEMLGHDCSLAYIHAVKLCNEKQILAKRVGYLACNIFLHKDHEFMLLLINTLQRDLKSSNHLEVAGALVSICRLVNGEMIPAILPEVMKCLAHSHESVRKKAIVALHKIYRLDPSISVNESVRKVLCDQDPSVMGASLHMLHELAKQATAANKDLVPSFLSILKQIIDHRLPREFDYHRVPAPWIQIKILAILGTLGHADLRASEQMYPVLAEVMKKSDMNSNVGYAILYECVKTITKIYPHPPLLEQAAQSISRFISSENHNLKYLGVTGLAAIVQMNPKYAAEHQMVVVDCLEDPDDTLKRKTLDLLYKMANPQNCTVVAEKLLFHLQTTQDLHLRRELTQRLCTLAERYAPSNEWYINTMTEVFQLAGELLPNGVSHSLMRFVAEGLGASEEEDVEFRRFCVNLKGAKNASYQVKQYVKLLAKTSGGKRCPDVLLQVSAWVLGEYGDLCTVDGYGVNDLTDLLCECLSFDSLEANETRCFVLSALTKLVAQHESLRADATITEVVDKYCESKSTDLQQRCYELRRMLQSSAAVMKLVLPYDAACEDVSVDAGLSFLNAYAEKTGGVAYQTKAERVKLSPAGADQQGGGSSSSTSGAARGGPGGQQLVNKGDLNFTPYEAPKVGPKGMNMGMAAGGAVGASGAAAVPGGGPGSGDGGGEQPTAGLGGLFDMNNSAGVGQGSGLVLQGNNTAARKWGPAGYNEPAALRNSTAASVSANPTPAATATPSAPSQIPTAAEASKPAVAAAAKPVDRKQTEREKMAAALFSGMLGAGGSSISSTGAGASTTPTGGAQGQNQNRPHSNLSSGRPGGAGEKGGGGTHSSATSSTTTHTSPADDGKSTAQQIDLLGDVGGDAPQSLPQAGGSGGDLLGDDLLGLGPATVAANPPSYPATSAESAAGDLLSLDMGASAPASAALPPMKPSSGGAPPLRPLAIKIDQLGAEWPTLLAERNVTVASAVPSCDALVSRLESLVGVARVEVIGQEAISAGTDSTGGKVFLHARLDPGAVNVVVKTAASHTADAVASFLQQKL